MTYYIQDGMSQCFDLDALGYEEMAPCDKIEFRRRLFDELSERVGQRIMDSITNAQYDEYEMLDQGTNAQALEWANSIDPDLHGDRVMPSYGDFEDWDKADEFREHCMKLWFSINVPDAARFVAEEVLVLEASLVAQAEEVMAEYIAPPFRDD